MFLRNRLMWYCLLSLSVKCYAHLINVDDDSFAWGWREFYLSWTCIWPPIKALTRVWQAVWNVVGYFLFLFNPGRRTHKKKWQVCSIHFEKFMDFLLDICLLLWHYSINCSLRISCHCNCRLQQYRVVEMKLLAQQRDLQVYLDSKMSFYVIFLPYF